MTRNIPHAEGADRVPAASDSPASRPVQTTFERTEQKYLLARDQYLRVRELLAPRCHEDEFAYSTISSLYYDDAQFTMINRSIERPLYKQKIRVRAYAPFAAQVEQNEASAAEEIDAEHRDDAVYVELKKKFKGITYKRRFPASPQGAEAFLSGMPYEQAQREHPLADEGKRAACFSWKNRQIAREIRATVAQYGRIEPKIMVDVDRVALRADERGDLRITFDLDSRYRTDHLSFAEGTDGTPLFGEEAEEDAYAIMEVKCAEAYPFWLVELLSHEGLYCRPCSKVGNAYMHAFALAHRAPAQARDARAAGSFAGRM